MKTKLTIIGMLLLASFGSVEAEEINILFMGNSFTYRHDLAKLVKQVFEEGQPDLTVNDGHPNQFSAFLAANMFYASFFKESTEGFKFNTVVENKSKGKGEGQDPDGGDAKVVFEESTKTLLQKAAFDAVMEFSAGNGK